MVNFVTKNGQFLLKMVDKCKKTGKFSSIELKDHFLLQKCFLFEKGQFLLKLRVTILNCFQ